MGFILYSPLCAEFRDVSCWTNYNFHIFMLRLKNVLVFKYRSQQSKCCMWHLLNNTLASIDTSGKFVTNSSAMSENLNLNYAKRNNDF